MPLEGDCDTIYTFKMSEENHENKQEKKPSNARRLADFASMLRDPSDPRYKGAVGIEQALEFQITQQTKAVEQIIANVDKAKHDLKHFQSGLADHIEDHAEALNKLNNAIRDVEDELSEIIPVSVFTNLIVDGDDAEIYDQGLAEDFQDALNALSYQETQEIVRLQDQLRNLRKSRADAMQWDTNNTSFHQLGIDKCEEIIEKGEKQLEEGKQELARLLSLRPEEGYFAHKKEQEEQRKNDARVAELESRLDKSAQMHKEELAEWKERAERAEALLQSEKREVTPAQRIALDEQNKQERQAQYTGNKSNREIEFKKNLPFIINWINQAQKDGQDVRLMLRSWKPKQSIFMRAGIDVDGDDVIQVLVRGHYRNNMAIVEFIRGKNTGKTAILAIGYDEKAGVFFVQTCFNEDDRWGEEEIKVLMSINKTKSDRLTKNQRLQVRSAVLEKLSHGLNTDLVGATMINPVTSIVLGN